MEFRVERRSGVPTYLQLVDQVKRALRLGVLRPGERLPTAKEVVAVIAVNPNTVFKAYRELEREGLVEARPGRGTFVLRTLRREDANGDGRLRAGLRAWLATARADGLDRDDIEALITDVVDQQFRRGE